MAIANANFMSCSLYFSPHFVDICMTGLFDVDLALTI